MSELFDPRLRDEILALQQDHGVPGMQLGVLRLDRRGREVSRIQIESGVLDVTTGAPVRPESSFQIGSITKVVTAIAALRCAERGLLSMTAPVRDQLPALTLQDHTVAERVTLADLLCHRSGIEGERYRETGEGADAMARYVDDLADAAQVHPLGRGFSYSNTAYVIAGRAIEVATGESWADAVTRLVLEPLGLEQIAAPTRADELASPAFGHVPDDTGRLTPAEPWRIPPGMASAGLLTSNAAGVLDLLALSLRRGELADGSRLLSSEAADSLLGPVVATGVPGIEGWGLGWMRERWGRSPVFGHDGGTNGQFAFARALPEQGSAYCLLTNGGQARAFFDELMPRLTRATAASVGPLVHAPRADGMDRDLKPGRYRNGDGDLVLAREGARMLAALVDAGADAQTFSQVHPAASGRGCVWQKPGETHWRSLVPVPGASAVMLGTRRMRRIHDHEERRDAR